MSNPTSPVRHLYFWYNDGTEMSWCDDTIYAEYSRNRLPPDFTVRIPPRTTDKEIARFVAIQQKVYSERTDVFDPEYDAPAFFFGVYPQKRSGKGISPQSEQRLTGT